MNDYKAAKLVIAKYAATRTTQRRPYTIASVTARLDGRAFTGIGFSKCCPRDEWSSDLGREIAIGRALKDVFLKVLDDPSSAWLTLKAEVDELKASGE